VGPPFADWLQLTTPLGELPFLRDRVVELLEDVGASHEAEDLYRLGAGGSLQFGQYGLVGKLGVSGEACASLRTVGAWGELLAVCGEAPHRVTRLDATLDVLEDARPVVRRLARLGRQGKLRITRKALRPEHVTEYRGSYPDGTISGTVYLGSRHADVRPVVYDKRLERVSKDFPDPGPCTRYEIRIRRGAGVTLRDAWDPTTVFWHFASPGLLQAPEGVSSWEPHAEGFDVPSREPFSPGERVVRLMQDSRDFQRLARIVADAPPNDRSALLNMIRVRLDPAVQEWNRKVS
jgi:hypothetical protein